MDRCQMGVGRQGFEAGVQILPRHRGRQKTTRGRRVEMEETDRRGCPDHVACRGKLMKWWRKKNYEEDLDRELRADLELEAEEQEAKGLSSREARDAAQRAFGNVT